MAIKYEDEPKIISHSEFEQHIKKLSSDIRKYCKINDVRIDYVVPILRSGAVPAVYIANDLEPN